MGHSQNSAVVNCTHPSRTWVAGGSAEWGGQAALRNVGRKYIHGKKLTTEEVLALPGSAIVWEPSGPCPPPEENLGEQKEDWWALMASLENTPFPNRLLSRFREKVLGSWSPILGLGLQVQRLQLKEGPIATLWTTPRPSGFFILSFFFIDTGKK